MTYTTISSATAFLAEVTDGPECNRGQRAFVEALTADGRRFVFFGHYPADKIADAADVARVAMRRRRIDDCFWTEQTPVNVATIYSHASDKPCDILLHGGELEDYWMIDTAIGHGLLPMDRTVYTLAERVAKSRDYLIFTGYRFFNA